MLSHECLVSSHLLSSALHSAAAFTLVACLPAEGTLQGEDQLDPSAEGSHHLSGSGGGSRPGAVEQMQNASMEWGASLADDGVLLAGSPPGSDDESPGIETADRATS